MSPALRLADESDLPLLMPMVAEYHVFDGIGQSIASDRDALAQALTPLLRPGEVGRIWLIEHDRQTIGYGVLCFGYSVEFGGRDAFVDELFLREEWRGQGHGTWVMGLLMEQAEQLGVRQIHLEVDQDNVAALTLYEKHGFAARGRFKLLSRSLGD